MADFETAFIKTLKNEGGLILHNVKDDKGGMTYAGISRINHPSWTGWVYIDKGEIYYNGLTQLVREFYKEKFWDLLRCEEIKTQTIAENIYDFAVNAGNKTAIKLAQIVVNTIPDGSMGPKTLNAINEMDGEKFILKYFTAKMARYAEICMRDKTQSKFLLGWVNRSLRGAA